MFKNWSKVVLVSLLVLMVAASLSYATTARVRSLAHTGDYMSDDSNAMRWYSVLPMYANQVNAEIGTWGNRGESGFDQQYLVFDSRAMSVNYACGEDGKWGTYRISLNENALDHPGLWSTNGMFMMMLPGSAPNLFGVSTPMNKWDFAGGWEISESVALGASLTRSSWDYEDPEIAANQSFTTVGVGGTFTNNDGFAVDGTFTWGIANGDGNFENNPGIGVEEPYTVEFDSKNAIEIGGRAFWDWKDFVTVVPVASFQTAEYSLTDNEDPTVVGALGTGDKMRNVTVGVGLNLDVNTDNMLIVAAEFNHMKWEYSNADTAGFALSEITGRYLPTIRMALETSVTSWMTTRVGAAKHLGKMTVKAVNGDELTVESGAPTYFPFDDFFEDISSFEWTLGVGLNVAEWTVDLELGSEAPFSTFYWISGYSAYTDNSPYGPVTRISALYNF